MTPLPMKKICSKKSVFLHKCPDIEQWKFYRANSLYSKVYSGWKGMIFHLCPHEGNGFQQKLSILWTSHCLRYLIKRFALQITVTH